MWWRWSSTSLIVLAFIGLVWASVTDLTRTHRPNAILLTVESFRADAISPETTPNLLAAAREGLTFTGHHAVSGWTGTNIVTLLTGLSPFRIPVHAGGESVARELALPLEDLTRQGYRVSGLQSFMRIDLYRNLGLSIEAGVDPYYWMASRLEEGDPFFLWYHYLDTHLPYAPTAASLPDWKSLLPTGDATALARLEMVRTNPAIEAGAVAFQPSDRAAVAALHTGTYHDFDTWFGTFWNFFKTSGLARDTVLIVTADHGEEHLERGMVGHASTTRNGHLHEEIVHVPLFLWLPDGPEGPDQGTNKTLSRLTDHRDVMPTIMKSLGVRPTMSLGGSPLPQVPSGRLWHAVTSREGFGSQGLAGVSSFIHAARDGRWKLHVRETERRVTETHLYDLEADPAETTDRSEEHPDLVRRLQAHLGPRMDALHTLQDRARKEGPRKEAPQPRWVEPATSGVLHYADFGGRIRLRWDGPADANYRLHYEAGKGILGVKGTLDVEGLELDFGQVDESYWRTFVVPYGRVRMRVTVQGSDAWSDWVDLVLQP